MLTHHAADYAERVMSSLDSSLINRFKIIISFLERNQELLSVKRKIGESEYNYIERLGKKFHEGRLLKKPSESTTIPDQIVSEILISYFDVPTADAETAKKMHALSMRAENMVGDLLERYLASVLEPDWIWCSGSLVKAVDFLRPMPDGDIWSCEYRLIQIKNRDNSENSSSSAIRDGTSIEKWFRSFSKKSGDNWSTFPDRARASSLSEAGFQEFVRKTLRELKSS